MVFTSAQSVWTQFWHTPVRAERLALTRILLGVFLLADQLFQYLPYLDEFYGPHGVAPDGLHDKYFLRTWLWTNLFFRTDTSTFLNTAFALWVAVAFAFTIGWRTRWMNVLLWLLTLCFHNRNINLLNHGDNLLILGLFMLMFAPSGQALSVDSRRRKGTAPGPNLTPAWPVRLFQIQLAMIYCTTGLVKLRGDSLFTGTWWDGTSVHYVLNGVYMSRISYAQLPVPFWITAIMTYVCVWWEALFPLLVLWRRTRPWALWFGVLFHLGIWLTIELGWFSFYSVAMYGVWVPDRFWERWRHDGALPQESRG